MEVLNNLEEQPARSFYVAIGHDTELSGNYGARKMAEHLSKQNVSLAFIMDEGYMVVNRSIPGLARPVAA